MNHCTHTREAATAHLQSVGLTFEGFVEWLAINRPLDTEYVTYPAADVREYIKEANQL